MSDDETDRILGLLRAAWPTARRRDAEVLYLRYWEGLSFGRIGERLGVSAQRAHDLERKVLGRLRRPPARKAALELAPAGSFLRVVLFPHDADERNSMA